MWGNFERLKLILVHLQISVDSPHITSITVRWCRVTMILMTNCKRYPPFQLLPQTKIKLRNKFAPQWWSALGSPQNHCVGRAIYLLTGFSPLRQLLTQIVGNFLAQIPGSWSHPKVKNIAVSSKAVTRWSKL